MNTEIRIAGASKLSAAKKPVLKQSKDAFSSMIPVDEQAQVTDWTKLKVVHEETMDTMVPADESAIEPSSEEQTMALRLEKQKALLGMGHLCGVLSDKVYALVRVDENKRRTFVFCVEQGEKAPARIEIEQASLFRLANAQFNLDYMPKDEKKLMREKLTEIEDQILNTWESGDKPLQLMDVLEAIYHSRGQLPVVRALATDDRKEFYMRLKEKLFYFGCSVFEKKSYYAIIADAIPALAKEMGMHREAFIRKLDQLGLIYKQPSSTGFMSKVRIYDTTDWMLCIYRLEFFPESYGGLAEG